MSKKTGGESRTVNALRNVVFNLGYQVVNTVVNIILPPLIIGKFGSATNGLISTIKQIMGYIQLVGAGISESTVVSLYKPLAEGDRPRISSIYRAVGKAFNLAGILFSVASVLVAFIYPLFVGDELDYWFIVKMVLVLSIAGMSEFFAIGKYRSLLTADQRVFVINLSQMFGAIVSTVLTVVLIRLDCNVLLVQLAASLAYVCRIFVLSIYVRKKYRYLDKTAPPDPSAISRRKAATIHQLASLIIFGSQSLIIASFCGFAEASVYSVYNLIFSGINTLLSTMSSAMLASMGNLMATDDAARVRRVYSIYEFVYYVLMFSCYGTALAAIIPFVNIYTAGITDVEYIRPRVIILFAILGICNCLRVPGGTMINAKGHYKETQYRALIETGICVVGQLIFVGPLGIEGVLLGTILSSVYRSTDVILYCNRRVLGQPVWVSVRRIVISLLPVIGFGCIMLVDVPADNYFMWILYAFLAFVAALIVVLLVNFVFERKTIAFGFGYVKEILKGKKRS